MIKEMVNINNFIIKKFYEEINNGIPFILISDSSSKHEVNKFISEFAKKKYIIYSLELRKEKNKNISYFKEEYERIVLLKNYINKENSRIDELVLAANNDASYLASLFVCNEKIEHGMLLLLNPSFYLPFELKKESLELNDNFFNDDLEDLGRNIRCFTYILITNKENNNLINRIKNNSHYNQIILEEARDKNSALNKAVHFMTRFNSLKKKIMRTEKSFLMNFSSSFEFANKIYKWKDSLLDMYDHNYFEVNKKCRSDDILKMINYQKEKNYDYLKILTPYKVSLSAIKEFDLEEDKILTMAFLNKNINKIKTNGMVKIKDVCFENIVEDILSIEDEYYGEIYGHDFVLRKMKRYFDVSKNNIGLHYLGAYINDHLVGAVYYYEKNDVRVLDALIVRKEYRHQYVASTLIKHIISSFKGMVYLHAQMDDTPQKMYAKMGFVTCFVNIEYFKKLK